MDVFTLLLPLLVIAALIAGLALLKRHLTSDVPAPAPIPIPETVPDHPGPRRASQPGAADDRPPALAPVSRRTNGSGQEGLNLSPARLYPRVLLSPAHKSAYSRLLKALPGYVVLPKIGYDHFLDARDGSPSENTSLQKRAAQHLADFVVCDKKLQVLLVCQLDDGAQLPARVQERERMLHKAGLRLLRWNVEHPPDPAKLLSIVQTLQGMSQRRAAPLH